MKILKRIMAFCFSRRFLCGMAVGALLLVLGKIHCDWESHRAALTITLKWARLAPFPEGAYAIQTEVTGNIFTREFRVRLRAPCKEINAWLAKCPGVQDAKIQQRGKGLRKYEIKPGGGAQHAELTIDTFDEDEGGDGDVAVWVFWS